MFLWARHLDIASGAELSYKAAEQNSMHGPGHLFSTDLAPSPWLRFNVAYCTDGAVFSFLEGECRPASEADRPAG
jgi:hypothetical protein